MRNDIDLIGYCKRDRNRILAAIGLSFVVIASHSWLTKSISGSLLIVVAVLFALFLCNSAAGKGRMFKDEADHYFWVNVWKKNIKGSGSVLVASVSLLLMQFSFFYLCALILLFLANGMFWAESFVDCIPKCDERIRSYSDAIYVTFVSASTIGFGDIAPGTWIGRSLAIASSLVGLLFFGVVTACVWQAIEKTFVVFRDAAPESNS